MQIRTYRPSDIEQISLLYFNTIRCVNARDYTEQQLRAWAPGVPDNSFWSNRFADRAVFVAELYDKVIGFVEFEKTGHIDCFYVHHEFIHQGVGSQLMQKIENESRQHNIRRLSAEVSLTARGFFQSKGFITKGERIVEYNNAEFQLCLMGNLHGVNVLAEKGDVHREVGGRAKHDHRDVGRLQGRRR